MTSQKQQLNEQKMINHLSTVGILGNVILTAFKLLAGIIGHSGAMISDAVHSLSDVFATFIAFLGVKLSKKSADSEHPYGHDRLECVASMVLAAILLATGIGIGMSGVKTIIAGDYSHLQAPGTIALVAAIVSILTKEGMFWYTRTFSEDSGFRSIHGRCMASQIRCIFFRWFTDWYRWCNAWISCAGSAGKCRYLYFYLESSI